MNLSVATGILLQEHSVGLKSKHLGGFPDVFQSVEVGVISQWEGRNVAGSSKYLDITKHGSEIYLYCVL